MASSSSRIMFFDVINPENPEFKSQFVPVHSDGSPLHDADGLAVTRLPNGLYLMAVGSGFHGDEPIYFYRSSSNELGSKDLTWELVGTVHDINDHDEDAHQSLHFLREGNIEGPLYLAGSRGHPVFGADHDKLDLFQVTASLRTARPWASSPHRPLSRAGDGQLPEHRRGPPRQSGGRDRFLREPERRVDLLRHRTRQRRPGRDRQDGRVAAQGHRPGRQPDLVADGRGARSVRRRRGEQRRPRRVGRPSDHPGLHPAIQRRGLWRFLPRGRLRRYHRDDFDDSRCSSRTVA